MSRELLRIVFQKNALYKKAFSTVEMAVVIASIATIVTLTLGGNALVDRVRLQSVISDINRFTYAINSFEKNYHALPGDLADISALSGLDENARGNGNGVIDESEALLVWQHLAAAQLITGHFDGESGFIPGKGIPAGNISGSGYTITPAASASSVFSGAVIIDFASFSDGSGRLPVLTAEDAKSLDDKIDDGLPASGIIRAYGAGTTSHCVSDNQYNLSHSGTNCLMRFILDINRNISALESVSGCSILGTTREVSDPDQRCPVGYQGMILETCHLDTEGNGTWQIAQKNCRPVTCSGGALLGEKRKLDCINQHVGQGIIQTCSKYGVWITDPDQEEQCILAENSISCPATGLTREALACDWEQEGMVIMRCNDALTWHIASSEDNQCQQITCGSTAAVGEIRIGVTTGAPGCGNNYRGDVTELCTLSGRWQVVANHCSPQYEGNCESGAERDIGCPPGEYGHHIQSCQAGETNYWTTQTDTCKAITCSGSPLGETRVAPRLSCPQGSEGTIFEICQDNGHGEGIWQVSDSNCIARICSGGDNTDGFANWPNVTPGSTATASSCIEGYQQNDTLVPTRQCSSEGIWQMVDNPCIPILCPSEISNHACWPESESGIENVTGFCLSGWSGTPRKSCNNSGEWTDLQGVCTAINIPATDGMVLWLDGSDLTTLSSDASCSSCGGVSDGDVIGCWRDKSEQNNHARIETNQPSLLTNAVNTLAVIDFDNQHLLLDHYIPVEEDSSVFIVAQGDTHGNLFSYNHTLTQSHPVGLWLNSGIGSRYRNISCSTLYAYDEDIISSSQYALISAQKEAAAESFVTLDRNGRPLQIISDQTACAGMMGSNLPDIPAQSSIAGFNGRIAEMIIYDGVLDNSKKQTIEEYLAKKWGIFLFGAPAGVTEGLVVWFDATEPLSLLADAECQPGSSPTEGSRVACWLDKAGNGFNAVQSNPSSRPVYHNNVTNGQPMLMFDNNNDFFSAGPLTQNSQGSENYDFSEGITAFAVIFHRDTPSDDWGALFEKRLNQQETDLFALLQKSGSTDFRFETAGAQNGLKTLDTVATPTNQALILTLSQNATNNTIYVNGHLEAQRMDIDEATYAISGDFLIGSRVFGDSFEGYIGEIILYNRSLDSTQQNAIEQYLAEKWQITLTDSYNFSPLFLADLALWLDASDTESLSTSSNCSSSPAITSGDAIACWRDKSSHSNHALQNNGISQPVWQALDTTTTINGYPVVTFDGLDDLLAGGPVGISGSEPGTVFIVLRQNGSSSDTSQKIFGLGTDDNNINKKIRLLSVSNQSDGTGFLFGDGQRIFQSYLNGNAPALTTWIWEDRARYGQHQLYINGVLATEATSLNSNTRPNVKDEHYFIGSAYEGKGVFDDFFSGQVGEIIAYNRALSRDEIDTVESYLTDKWGL